MSHNYAPNCSCTHDQFSVFYSYSSFSIRNIYSLPLRILLIGRTLILSVTRVVICADDWEFQRKKHLCERPDEWLFLGSSMLPITEKRDNLVLKAVYFFIYLFILVILAHERFVRKKKTFPEPKIILQSFRNER